MSDAGSSPGAAGVSRADDFRRAALKALSRRRFLALAGGVGGLGVLGAGVGPLAWRAAFGTATDAGAGAGAAGRGAKTLVLLTLYGGNDGLNTVVPYQDSAYLAARGSLAVEASTVLPLGEGYGLHPGMPGFKKLWDAKQLAIVQGVGFADPNYSHFESMDIWQSGVPGTPVSTGWLGRWLDAMPADPLRAVGIGPSLPTLLTGEKAQGAMIPPGPLVLPGGDFERSLYAAMAETTPGEPSLLAQAAMSGADLLSVAGRVGPILTRTVGSDPLHLTKAGAGSASGQSSAALAIADGGGGLSSANVLAVQLSVVANLILAGCPTEVYSVELGGFDTHTFQAPTQTRLLAELDAAVSAFVDALSDSASGRQTVVLIYTEFGRRVVANSSGGTDHGWANPVFLAGHAVKGGFYGEPPSLTKLSEGNTVYTTDFRSVYATVLGPVLGVDPKPFLEGSFAPLPLL